MRVFARVAHRSGFAPAARDLRMSPAAVTKHVAALEARVGSRLFDRTTRKVALTEAGRIYLERCLACLQACDDADASVRRISREPSGLLRVTAPYDLQHLLAPPIARFVRANPKVRLDLRYSNRSVDLVEEGFDVAVRVSRSLQGQFVARTLTALRVVVCGSPEYFDTHGRPRTPRDLARHRFAVLAEPIVLDEVPFDRNGKRVLVKLETAVLSNGGQTLVQAAVAGACMVIAPSVIAAAELSSGLLEPVLADWEVLPGARLSAIYPHRRFVSPAVRAFVDWLRKEIDDDTAQAYAQPVEPVSHTRRQRTA
jgi:DNA-binding transcriptional LysR family regulator